MSRFGGRGRRSRATVEGTALALAGTALLLAGCGGGGSSTLTHQELVSKANAACAAANAQAAALPAPKATADLVPYLSRSERIVLALKEKISALPAAQADRASVQRYVGALTKADAVLDDMTNAARNENAAAVKFLAGDIAAANIGPAAARAGFSTCATAPGS
jgi:hypothetical protein